MLTGMLESPKRIRLVLQKTRVRFKSSLVRVRKYRPQWTLGTDIFLYEVLGFLLLNLLVFISGVLTVAPDLREPKFYFFFLPPLAVLLIFKFGYPRNLEPGIGPSMLTLMVGGAVQLVATQLFFIPVSTIITGGSVLAIVSSCIFRFLDKFSYVASEVEELRDLSQSSPGGRGEAYELLHAEVHLWLRTSLSACIYGYVILTSAFAVLWTTGRTPLNIALLASVVLLLTYALYGAFLWIIKPLLDHASSLRSLMSTIPDPQVPPQ